MIEAVETIDGQVAVAIRLADAKEGEETVARLAVADMAEARLVLTEELIRDALRREKSQVKARRGERRRPSPKPKAETAGNRQQTRRRNPPRRAPT